MTVSLKAEVENVSLGDKRLDRRLGILLEELGNAPRLSIPAATTRRAEMEAAYRFFDNEKVTPDKILQPHFAATLERISQTDMVLLVQDTTELNLTRPQQQVEGAGPMDSDSRRGAFLHPLVAFDQTGLPLGVAWQKAWTRDKLDSQLSKQQRAKKRFATPIEKKESIRWIEGLRAAREIASSSPNTTCVCVGDSEADIYETFSEPRDFTTSDGRQGQVHVLVRARQQRATDQASNWFQQVRENECLYTDTFNVSHRSAPRIASNMPRKRQQSRNARTAAVEIRALSVTLRPPYRLDRKLPVVDINLVLIEESDPPEGCEPISWLLATSLPIDTVDKIKQIVKAYCQRWQIEIFFRTMKSGCRVEQRQFENINRILNCVALYSIIAWRVMYLCRLGRECPELSCETVFDACEWKSVYQVVTRKEPPTKPPQLNVIIRMIAILGGYVDRSKNLPGPQTVWTGLQRVNDLSTAWNAFGPDT